MARHRRQRWDKEDEKGTVSRRWGQGLGREPGRGPRPESRQEHWGTNFQASPPPGWTQGPGPEPQPHKFLFPSSRPQRVAMGS